MQLSLFPIPPKPPKQRIITVSRVPHIQTFLKHAWIDHERLSERTDEQILKAWVYSHVMDCLCRFNMEPRGYVHRAHHHIPHQIRSQDRIALVDAEFKRRNLHEVYTLFVDILP